ncbi:MAG: arsenate reductase (glutaredoxin) [Alphaproteobacteria bacterium]
MSVTIYHNPRCTKSRETLALLEKKGVKPTIVEYLKTPPSAAELKKLLAMMGKSPREAIRKGEAPYKDLNLAEASDAELIKAMTENPILIERPIVVKGAKAALGRPPESVLAIL